MKQNARIGIKSTASIAASVAVAVFLQGCSNEAKFANGNRLTNNGADATAGSSPGQAGEFDDPTRSQIDDHAGGSWEPLAFTRVLPIVDRQEVSADIRPAFGQIDETIPMKVRAESRVEFRQVVRNDISNAFRQGHDGVVRTETFSVTRAGNLDLLVVVDNSTSMEEEQENLSQKLEALTSAIDDTNWQIAVVNMSNPCLRQNRIIKRGDADRVEAFRKAASVGMSNNVVEKGYPMAIRALKGECNGKYAPWLRDGSTVAVLIVTDEDNCGSNNGSDSCKNDYGKNATEMTEFLRQIRPTDKAKLYGIHWVPNDHSCGTALGEAWKYQEGISITSGYAGSICDADYTRTLNLISQNVRRAVVKEFVLADDPDLRVIEVAVDGEALASGYSVTGKKVIVDAGVTDGKTTLVVTYSSGGVAKFDSVTLNKIPDDNTISVVIDGVALDPSSWTYDPATRVLRFTARPADASVINVRYKEKTAWRNQFSLWRSDVVSASVGVAVNHVAMVGGWTFNAQTGTVTFADYPPEGATIGISYRVKSDYTTDYPVAISQPDKIQMVVAVDVATNEAVPVQFLGTAVRFAVNNVASVRIVRVTYDYGEANQEQTWELSTLPEEGTFEMVANPPGACTSDVRVEGKTLHFRCAPGDRATLHVEYKTITGRRSSFDVSAETGVDDSKIRLQSVVITVDGVETEDYQLAAGRLTFGAAAVANAKGDGSISAKGVRRKQH